MKKPDFFFAMAFGALEICDETAIEGVREACRKAISVGGSRGEGQKEEDTGDVRFVEVVAVEAVVDIVVIDSTSDALLRYESLGRRNGSGGEWVRAWVVDAMLYVVVTSSGSRCQVEPDTIEPRVDKSHSCRKLRRVLRA